LLQAIKKLAKQQSYDNLLARFQELLKVLDGLPTRDASAESQAVALVPPWLVFVTTIWWLYILAKSVEGWTDTDSIISPSRTDNKICKILYQSGPD